MPVHELDRIKSDFDKLQLTVDFPDEIAGWTTKELDDLLACTQEIGPSKRAAAVTNRPLLITEFGVEIADLILQDPPIEFYADKSVGCCIDGDTKLVQNINPGRVANDELYSPLILTRQSRPAAIIKGLGETTCYALLTDAESGLVAGTFCTISSDIIKGKPPKARHAWQRPLERQNRFRPVRFATFHLPQDTKDLVQQNPDINLSPEALNTSHEDIYERAREMLKTAKLLPYQASVGRQP